MSVYIWAVPGIFWHKYSHWDFHSYKIAIRLIRFHYGARVKMKIGTGLSPAKKLFTRDRSKVAYPSVVAVHLGVFLSNRLLNREVREGPGSFPDIVPLRARRYRENLFTPEEKLKEVLGSSIQLRCVNLEILANRIE